jgi:hypothetical protein
LVIAYILSFYTCLCIAFLFHFLSLSFPLFHALSFSLSLPVSLYLVSFLVFLYLTPINYRHK